MFVDGFGYLLASSQARSNKSERIASVERGTGPTYRLSSAAACFQQDAVGKIAGVESDVEAAFVADPDHTSGQTHRSLAAPHGPYLGFECVEATGGMQSADDPVDDAVFVK